MACAGAFICTADEVGAEVADYRCFVNSQVARFGRNHPMFRTQYFSETIDEESGMFPAQRIARMAGMNEWQDQARPGLGGDVPQYTLLIDVGGEPLSTANLSEDQRDATELTVVEVAPSALTGTAAFKTCRRSVSRQSCTGICSSWLRSNKPG